MARYRKVTAVPIQQNPLQWWRYHQEEYPQSCKISHAAAGHSSYFCVQRESFLCCCRCCYCAEGYSEAWICWHAYFPKEKSQGSRYWVTFHYLEPWDFSTKCYWTGTDLLWIRGRSLTLKHIATLLQVWEQLENFQDQGLTPDRIRPSAWFYWYGPGFNNFNLMYFIVSYQLSYLVINIIKQWNTSN